MKRLSRILLNALTVLSLLLFVATVALWVRSHRRADVFPIGTASGGHVLHSHDGGVAVIEYESINSSGQYVVRSATAMTFVPYPWVVVASGIAPAIWGITRVLRKHAAVPGVCVRCGYDLRATPERCPECGQLIRDFTA